MTMSEPTLDGWGIVEDLRRHAGETVVAAASVAAKAETADGREAANRRLSVAVGAYEALANAADALWAAAHKPKPKAVTP